MTLKTRSTLALALLGAFFALPALAQEEAAPAAVAVQEAAPVAAAPEAAPAAVEAAPAPAPTPDVKGPEMTPPPKQTGPVYNPPPPSGKDWGKLPQEAREGILNEWKSLPEKDREPFIFYRERAMAKLPDSAYSDNPYKPESPEAVAAKAAATAVAAPAAADEKSEPGFFDKLMGKDAAE